MDWIEKVNHALSYIEKNLYDEIQYKEIEKIILSPVEVLQRFFMLNTGITLTEYIRRRKLSEAVKMLKTSEEKIIDIAVKLGYGSSDAFSLAFKRLYGISPSDVRLSNTILKPCPRMMFSLSITYIEGDIKMKNINEIKPFIEEQEIFIMPDVRIIGKAYRCTFSWEETPWDKIWDEWESAQKVIATLPRIVETGWISWTGDSPEGSDYYTYMPSVICPANTPVPDGLDYRDLPASYVAKGEYGDEIGGVIGKFTPNGFITCYTDLGWNAELYLYEEEENPPVKDCSPFRWLVPCVKINET